MQTNYSKANILSCQDGECWKSADFGKTQNWIMLCAPHSGSRAAAEYFNAAHEIEKPWRRPLVSGVHFDRLEPDYILVRNPWQTIDGMARAGLGNKDNRPGVHWGAGLVEPFPKSRWTADPLYNACYFWCYIYGILTDYLDRDNPPTVLHLECAPFFNGKNKPFWRPKGYADIPEGGRQYVAGLAEKLGYLVYGPEAETEQNLEKSELADADPGAADAENEKISE